MQEELTIALKLVAMANRRYNELFILMTDVPENSYSTMLLAIRSSDGSQQRAINRPKRRNEADK